MRRAQNGDARARARIVESQLPQVLHYALKCARYQVPVAELVSEGTIGVLEAVDRFDVERGLRFSTYSSQWIRNYVLERVVLERAPYHSLRGAFRTRYWFKLRRELARAHTLGMSWDERVEHLTEQLGISRARVEEMLVHLGSRGVSFDTPGDGEDDAPISSVLCAPEAPPEEQVLSEAEASWLRSRIREVLERFGERDRDIVERRLMADEPTTLADLGREKGLSRQRIQQIEVRCRRKLETWLRPVHEQLRSA